MKKQMVVTSLRMEKNAWRQVKAEAGELGVSVNEYLNSLVWQKIGEQELDGKKIASRKKRGEEKFWEIYKIAQIPNKPMGASEENKIIYDIRD